MVAGVASGISGNHRHGHASPEGTAAKEDVIKRGLTELAGNGAKCPCALFY